ncbi:cyclic nucleotide-binding domain-containing protein [Roseomonas sp. HJA6]|uniref:Cyclic nucleotide-binding domain-containing protein n=1 Tax=Roseomonas alba TaxID=2846776 RepID=A0ABS7AAF7_9PROT|nr:cyclic nucleotide-binding domain-containing protein [Neoroseomonas alba]
MPGKPRQNALIERYNHQFREECSTSTCSAAYRPYAGSSRRDYNMDHPHPRLLLIVSNVLIVEDGASGASGAWAGMVGTGQRLRKRTQPRSDRFDLIGFLPPDARHSFEQSVFQRHYASGQGIYDKGDDDAEMFRVVSGEVRLTHLLDDGRELFHTLYRPGDCFGMLSLLDRKPRAQRAEAVGATEVQVLNQRGFDTLRRDHRAFDEALMLLLAGDIRGLIERVNSAKLEGLESRVARCILRYARDTEEGERVANLSQAALAAIAGASRQSVNKVLRDFQSDDLIAIRYAAIVIRDGRGLERRTNPV